MRRVCSDHATYLIARAKQDQPSGRTVMGKTPIESPYRVGFFLAPNFPMLAFSAAIEALRVANWVSGRSLYEWVLVSEDGGPVAPSSGIAMQPQAAMAQIDRLPIMIVCAGIGGNRYRN